MLRCCWIMEHCSGCTLYQWEPIKSDEPLLRCSKCKAVKYCSKDCQREHWKKQHKAHCKKMRVDMDFQGVTQPGVNAYWDSQLLHTPSNCSTCQKVGKLGSDINKRNDPHWGCLLGPFPRIIELRDQETSEGNFLTSLPFALGEQTGKFTSMYEQTLSLMQRVLHKMYITSHPLAADDARLRTMFQCIGGLRNRLLALTVQIPSGQILEYFHQDQLNSDLYLKLLEIIKKLSSEDLVCDGPYNLWKILQILIFFCLHTTHADKVLFEELDEQIQDETLAAALSRDESSEKSNQKRVAVLEGLEKGLMTSTDLLNILCEGNMKKTCSACNANICVEDMVFPFFVKPPARPSIFCSLGLSTFCCSKTSCFQTMSKDTAMLGITLQTIYHHFALKSTPNRCDMCFKFSKKVHRCVGCLTKVYCSEQCRDQDWNIIHKDICKKEQDLRKIKGGAKERRKDGKELLKGYDQVVNEVEESFEEMGLTEETYSHIKKIVKNISKKVRKN